MYRSICIPGSPPVDVSAFAHLLDTPPFQKLRGRRQLGVNFLVFPGAVHTRFEHALGVLALTQRLCAINAIGGDVSRLIQAFALLHDVGHGPFSHQLEPVLPGNHHERGIRVILALKTELDRLGVSPDDLIAMMHGTHVLTPWVSDRNLGADKLDYLARDALHIGFHGTPDIERIQHYTILTPDGIAIEEKFVEDAKQLQKFYSYLHQHGYLNKTALAAQRMLQRACQERLALPDCPSTDNIWDMDDRELTNLLLNAPRDSLCFRLADALLNRRLHKSFLVIKPEGYGFVEREADKQITVHEWPAEALRRFCARVSSPPQLAALENSLAEHANLPHGSILFAAMPFFKQLIPKDLRVFSSGGHQSYWLFSKDTDHRNSLESDYLRTFAIRLVCPQALRQALANNHSFLDLLANESVTT